MNTTDIYAQLDTVLAEQMDDDTLLYNPATASTLHLNSSSALVWQLCDGERSVGKLIEMLQQSYPTQAAQIAEDVLSALAEMQQHGVLLKQE